MSAAEISVRTVTRRRARTGTSFRIVDGVLVMVLLAAVSICFSYYRQMRAELRRVRAALSPTIVLVTHDPEDVAELADAVVEFAAGRGRLKGF